MLNQKFSEKFCRLTPTNSRMLSNAEHDSTFFSEIFSEKFSRFARTLQSTRISRTKDPRGGGTQHMHIRGGKSDIFGSKHCEM